MTSSEESEGFRRTAVYQEAFVRRCHELLAMGYARLDAASFRSEEETVITGELGLAITEMLESADAPPWAQHFAASEEQPVNAPGRSGKRRRRVDIEVIKTQRGRRPRMQFEAKRLHDSGSVSEYLGADGLGLFLAGEYAAAHPDAGMLGYVQMGGSADWADKIGSRLNGDCGRYKVTGGGAFRQHHLTPLLESTYRSQHNRRSTGNPITIFHTFLRFN